MSRFIKVNADECIECGLCEPACDVNAIKVGRKYISGGWDQEYLQIGVNISIKYIICHGCWECIAACPTGAISVLGGITSIHGSETGNHQGGNHMSPFASDALQFFNKYNNSLLREKINSLGLVHSIKTLEKAGVESLVKSLGGELTTEAKYILKGPLVKIAAVGTILDGLNTVVAFSDGEITSDDWILLGKTFVGVLGIVSGPIGILANGILVGIAIYELEQRQ